VGPIDTVGLGLIAVGLGALEYVLDKGQEDDWFNSPHHRDLRHHRRGGAGQLRSLGMAAGASGGGSAALPRPQTSPLPIS